MLIRVLTYCRYNILEHAGYVEYDFNKIVFKKEQHIV